MNAEFTQGRGIPQPGKRNLGEVVPSVTPIRGVKSLPSDRNISVPPPEPFFVLGGTKPEERIPIIGLSGSSDLPVQKHNLPNVLGKFSDQDNPYKDIQVTEGSIIFHGHPYAIESLDATLEGDRQTFLAVNKRVIETAKEISPSITTVFAPFNGGETLGLDSDYTIAMDRLPIGTPEQVQALHDNQYAKAIYLIDKFDRGYSYTGVTGELGYLGAVLQWDIEAIQKGEIEKVTYLDKEGGKLEDPKAKPSGIRIEYIVGERKRVHEQYSCVYPDFPVSIKTRLEERQVDGLYLRGTHNLVTKQEYFSEYKTYVNGVKSGGVIVSDAIEADLIWHIEDAFSDLEKRQVVLQEHEQFGYAGKTATIKDPSYIPPGHVTILKKT